jgi:hypothetical protein
MGDRGSLQVRYYEPSKKCDVDSEICVYQIEVAKKIEKVDFLLLVTKDPFANYKDGWFGKGLGKDFLMRNRKTFTGPRKEGGWDFPKPLMKHSCIRKCVLDKEDFSENMRFATASRLFDNVLRNPADKK